MLSELKKADRYAVFFNMATHKLKEHIQTLCRKPGHEKVRHILCNILKANLGAKESEIALEERLTCRGRIDTLWGRTIFEIKRNLSKERESAKSQLKQYIASKEKENKEKYVGIATDGKEYLAYCLIYGELKEINKFSLNHDKANEFIRWLESVVLIKDQLKATPEIICKEIGQESPLCRNSLLQIKYLWKQAKVKPDVRLKYNLWKKSVDIVYGTEGAEESLFIEHTYLTIISKAMAYVAFFDSLPSLGGDQLLNGKKFKEAGVHGIVEDDFFSWIVYCNAGKILIRNIASHVQRFDFSTIESDILKGLYEGLIRQEKRHKNGEYYTPDWLAEKVCKEAIKNPLEQRVIDPACGSGAFLFHSIKLIISSAKQQNISSKQTIKLICEKIAGIDIHPVAVIFSRITYLLAMLKEIKTDRPDTIEVPVYLGDSLQWQEDKDFGEMRIYVPEDKIKGAKKRQLIFPKSICQEHGKFDTILRAMIQMAGKLKEPSTFKAYSQNQSLSDSEKKTLLKTYTDLLELQKEDRNHIWGYVARNLTRPIWLSSEKQKADVVVGNPPWLRFNAMNPDMQKKFKSECESTLLWDNKDQNKASNSKFRTSQDISTYFFIMSAHLYMKEKGTLAFVLPYGVMNGDHHTQFRKGQFDVSGSPMSLKFEKAWTFDHQVKNLFKVPSCVLFSRRARNNKESKEPLPDIIQFKGKLPEKNCRLREAKKYLSFSKAKWPTVDFVKYSDYYKKFKQGASFVPGRFCFVEKVKAGKLGSTAKAPLVRGITSNLEKKPWKDIEPPQANIESQFLMPVYKGQSIAPFRVLSKKTGVIPWDNQDEVMMDSFMAERRGLTNLSAYLEKVEKLWDDHGKGKMSFKQSINFRNKITNQFPISDLRVVYTSSGTHAAAVLLEDPKGIIDTSLYWTTVKNQDEGLYLEGILNSASLVEKIRSLQAEGQWGPRHFHRHLLKPYFPKYNSKEKLHLDIVQNTKKIKLIAQDVELEPSQDFKKARQIIRKEIKKMSQGKVWQNLNHLVSQLLDKANISQTAS